MIFNELNKINEISLPVALKAALEIIGTNVLPSNIKYDITVDTDYLNLNKLDMVHFIVQNNVIKMVSRRKLNEEGLGKHLIYHPNGKYSLKLSHILNQTV